MKTIMRKKHPIALLFLGFMSSIAVSPFATTQGQTFYNYGAKVTFSSGNNGNPGGALIRVNGGVVNDGSHKNPASFTNNSNQFYIRTNANSTNPGNYTLQNGAISDGDGKYYVDRDWINLNAAEFRHGSSEVIFDNGYTNSPNPNYTQFIRGNVVTVFNHLTVAPTAGGKVQLDNINAETGPNGVFTLSHREFATMNNTMIVNNTSPAAIARTDGFVSSDMADGELVRHTASTESYLYPVGSLLTGTVVYRPIDLKPSANDHNAFGIRMVSGSPDQSGITMAASSVSGMNTKFNELFYHAATRKDDIGTASADLGINYIPGVDGDWSAIAFTDFKQEVWRNAGVAVPSTDNDFSVLTRPIWSFDRPKDKNFVLFYEEGLPDTLPNVVTLDGDGINDQFHIKNSNVKEFNLKVFNRWGVLVFETTAPSIDWDGKTNAGADVPTGTYFYSLKAITVSNKEINRNGFLELIR
jgi:gliding motility-associated-like protein